MMDNKTCETCKYGCFGKFREPSENWDYMNEEAWHCRKNAPQHFCGAAMGYEEGLWPRVDKTFWCGDYAPKEG